MIIVYGSLDSIAAVTIRGLFYFNGPHSYSKQIKANAVAAADVQWSPDKTSPRKRHTLCSLSLFFVSLSSNQVMTLHVFHPVSVSAVSIWSQP